MGTNLCKEKLKSTERELVSFSCGVQLQDADIPAHLKDIHVVYVRQTSLRTQSKNYYSAKFVDICVDSGVSVAPWSNKEPYYPQCANCQCQEVTFFSSCFVNCLC